MLSTLVHEMAHLWQHHFGKPSRSNYHNKEWGDKMREIGLVPSSTGAPGGKATGQRVSHYLVFNEAVEMWVADHGHGHLYVDLWDTEEAKAERAKKAASKTRYTCPGCEAHAWAKPDARRPKSVETRQSAAARRGARRRMRAGAARRLRAPDADGSFHTGFVVTRHVAGELDPARFAEAPDQLPGFSCLQEHCVGIVAVGGGHIHHAGHFLPVRPRSPHDLPQEAGVRDPSPLRPVAIETRMALYHAKRSFR